MKKNKYVTPTAEVFPICANTLLEVSKLDVNEEETDDNLSQEKEHPSDQWDCSNWDNLSGLK